MRDDSPSIQEVIGLVSMSWSSLEQALTIIMAELMETKPETAMAVSAALDYRHRRDIILSLASLKLRDHPLAARLAAFMGEVRGMAKERNNTIHALWGQNPDTGRMTRITMRNQGAYEMRFDEVGTRHLLTVQRKIASLANGGAAMAFELREAVHTWREKSEPLDWPPLGAT